MRPGFVLVAWLCGAVGVTASKAVATPADTLSVTFMVSVPPETPAEATLFISGDVPELGPWDPRGKPLTRLASKTHIVTLSLLRGSSFEFKITRGSWETVEKGPAGEEIPNRVLNVARAETLQVTVAKWRDQVEGNRPPCLRTVTGNVRDLGRVRSQALGNERDVWVYLPPGYDKSPGTRYPVVYFHDGQNVFDACTAFIRAEWQADETLEALIHSGAIREVIAVAVANTQQRMDEYTQVRDEHHGVGGSADAYLRFLVHELKPRIDAEFRTLPGREHTALVGSSLGGLVSLYGGVAAWETFGLVAGVSPVFAWGDHDLEKRYESAPREHLPLRIWIDMGTAEDPSAVGADGVPTHILELRRFRDLLVRRGCVAGRTLGYVEDPGAAHNETAWARRLPDILRFLVPPLSKLY